MKWARETTYTCKFNYDPVLVDFQPYIDRFETSYLQSIVLPPDADETCDDCVGDHEQ